MMLSCAYLLVFNSAMSQYTLFQKVKLFWKVFWSHCGHSWRADGRTVPYHDPSRLRASVRKCKYPIFAYGHHTMNAYKSKNDHSNRWTTFETLKLSSAKSQPFFHTDNLAAWLVIPWLMRYSSCTEAVMIRVYHFKFQRKLDNHFGIWITDNM